jgi:hypothetical protein
MRIDRQAVILGDAHADRQHIEECAHFLAGAATAPR